MARRLKVSGGRPPAKRRTGLRPPRRDVSTPLSYREPSKTKVGVVDFVVQSIMPRYQQAQRMFRR